MAYSTWLSVLGWGIFFIGLVLAIVLFAIRKKFYPVMYVVSVALYIFTIGFIIDAFNIGKEGNLILLAFSALVFIVLGMYFGKKYQKNKDELIQSIPVKR